MFAYGRNSRITKNFEWHLRFIDLGKVGNIQTNINKVNLYCAKLAVEHRLLM